MVRKIDMDHTFEYGETVVIPWGRDEVRATVAEIYGRPDDRRVVVILSPELSSYVVDEDTTMSLPIGMIRPAVSVGADADVKDLSRQLPPTGAAERTRRGASNGRKGPVNRGNVSRVPTGADGRKRRKTDS